MHLSVSSLVRIALLLSLAGSIVYGLNYLYQSFQPSASSASSEQGTTYTYEEKEAIVESLGTDEPVGAQEIQAQYEILEALSASNDSGETSTASSGGSSTDTPRRTTENEPNEAEIQAKLDILESLRTAQ